MYADSDAIRALARGMRERAQDLHTEADDLARRAAAVDWRGLAAEAMRRMTVSGGGGLHACADAHSAAAEALERHAREVDRVARLVSALARGLVLL
jgi:hypothetical protein